MKIYVRIPLVLMLWGMLMWVGLSNGLAQILKPVSWQVRLNPTTKLSVGSTAKVIFEATIDKDWYLYSSDFDPDLGPTVAVFTFKKSDNYVLIGKIRSVNPKSKMDEVFGGQVRYFVGKGVFEQEIKIIKPGNISIEGNFKAQACSDKNGTCVPIEDNFAVSVEVGQPTKTDKNQTAIGILEKNNNKTLPKSDIKAQNTSGTSADTAQRASTIQPKNTASDSLGAAALSPTTAAPTLASERNYQITGADKPLWQFALLAFASGLLALLTPCVFPLIPMTVSYFSRSASKFHALLYGFFIMVIYSLAGVLVALFNGPDLLNLLSTHWLPNVLFFGAFVVFGLSFLGAFEISLPSSWANTADKRAEKGGIVGVFFMALTLVIVSFSCTGPIVGAVLLQAAGGQMLKPIVGMGAFAFSFAIPFTLFAFFPSLLSKLPRSGGWLNSVKVVLGFVELGLAFKFLSMADQAYHWDLLGRDVYLVIWISLCMLTFLYLIGGFRLVHDGPKSENYVGVGRLMFAAGFFGFGLYLVPGLWGAPLQSLSGYLPPLHTASFVIQQKQQQAGHQTNKSNNICQTPLYKEFLHWPHGLEGYFDYQQALDCAKKLGKPVFIDFTGHGCVNCREMEARVWANPQVLARLQTDFVLLALYVDDKTALSKEKIYISPRDKKEKNTIGGQNADFQISRFGANAQPFYVVVDPQGNILTQPRSYNLDIKEFAAFLDEASKQMAKRGDK